MKLETFFEKFDQFADAPGAVAKMRELILRMATSGRVAEQDSADKPGLELLKEIFAVRDKLIRRGDAKNRTEGNPITAGDTIDLPPSWARCMISEVCDLQTGATPSRSEHSYFGGDTPWLVSGDINKGEITECDGRITKDGLENSNCKIIPANSVLIALNGQGKTRATVAVLRIPAALNQSLVAMIPYSAARLLPEYILWNLRGRYYAIRDITGQDQRRGLNMKLVGQLSLPIPPLAEQKRIVAKVGELMALCDRLDLQHQEREMRHTALARASLARFVDAPTPANLPFLFHPSYAISPSDLRKSILTLAFQGKLVPQDANDQSTVVLRDAPRKAEGKKAKWAGQVEEDEQPFQLPPSWKWVRLGDFSTLKHGYAFSSKFFTSELAPFVLTTPGNFYEKGGFRDRESKRKYYFGPVDPEFVFKPGDLIIPMTEQAAGLLGSPAFIPDDGRVYVHNQRLGKLTFSDSIAPEFAFWFFNCDFFRAELARTCTGMKVRHTSPDRVLKVPFPVPPLAEQRRIVAKVEQLMALVNELEEQLADSRATGENLLSALVAELTGNASDGKLTALSATGKVRRGRPKKSRPEITQTSPKAYSLSNTPSGP